MSEQSKNRPNHIAVIMDGNGRWAARQGLPRAEGHRAGAKTVEMIVETAMRAGIRYLTLYCLSSENWKRPKAEIDALMDLLRSFLTSQRDRLIKNKIRLRIIGRRKPIPEDILADLDRTAALTRDFDALTLTLAVNYGSRGEIVDAVRSIIRETKNGNGPNPETFGEEDFSRYLYTAGIPDPDLLIRTAGELRLSNYLLWQLSYAEIYVTPKCWPDFDEAEFYAALDEYARRNRKFGAVSEKLE